jgi:tRNA U34 5-methylaminomethyl-2-thiouridine-forming methyltransferase MnmC
LPSNKPAIEATGDGSQTLRHHILGELYHSSRGAVGESEHVFIRNGLDCCMASPVKILEIGFGSGLNALLTLQSEREIEYTALELYPVEIDTVMALDYARAPFFAELHKTPWNEWSRITPMFRLRKLEVDLVNTHFNTTFDLVYFDAFAPDCQPELWSREVFGRIFEAMNPGGMLVTYSAKGTVKQAMRDVGFEVRRIPGALGKRHMIRALKR